MGDTLVYANRESKPSSKKRERFSRMCDLHSRYIELKDNHPSKSDWEALNKMWDRWDYCRDNKPIDTNLGQFRFKVSREIGRFEDVITQRSMWAKITSYEGKDDKQRSEYGQVITEKFHEFCIDPWEDKAQVIRMNVFDMVMYGKGIEHWENNDGFWPKNIPVTTVFPDKNAGIDPREFDLLFISKKYTVGELCCILDDKEDGDGWHKEALLDLIDFADSLSANDPKDNFDMYSRGKLSPKTQDMSIDLIWAYVKEYDESITLYIFPESGAVVPQSTSYNQDREVRYLRSIPNFCECMSHVLAIRSNITTRSYWNSRSFAELIFPSCKLYDKVMNRIIRTVLRNSILFLKSTDSDQQLRLSSLTDDEVQNLNPDDDIAKAESRVDVGEMFQMLRQVMFDVDSSMGAKLATGSQNVKGRAITAREAELQDQNATRESNVDVKMFMICEGLYLKELYRRFIDLSHGNCKKEKKMRDMFIKAMEANGIPKEAYDPDNVFVCPYYNPSAATPQGIISGAQVILEALSRTPQSDGEHRAMKDLIGAVVGSEAVNYYLPDREYIDRDALQAGMENEAMSNKDVFAQNVLVIPDQNHVIHMTMHLANSQHVIETVAQKFQLYGQSIEEDKPIILDDLAGMLISLDLQMSHMEAHIQMAARGINVDKRIKPLIEAWKSTMQQIRLREQAAENQLAALKQERIQTNRQDLDMTLDQRHKQAMYQIEEEHAKKMSDLKLGSSVEKTKLSLNVSEAKHTQKIQQQAVDGEIKIKQAQQGLELSRQKEASKLAAMNVKAENQITKQNVPKAKN